MTSTLPALTPLAATLRAHGFVGHVVEPDHFAFDSVRMGWNAEIDRRPVAVAQALDTEDVAAAIRAARAAGLPFTVRAGGHSVSGRSLREGALCIDMRALNSVAVDAATGVVRAGGGALLAELDAATQACCLAVPAGQISHTGIGGLTLGGGIGWLMRKHGLTIDSLRECEVVLADGRVVRASRGEHPDLFWALRGGGGDFAAVTEFVYRAHPVGPEVLAGMLVYPWEQAGAALRATRALMDAAPPELTTFVALITAPPTPPFPDALHGRKAVAVTVAWCGEHEEGRRVLSALTDTCPPALDLVGPMPYVALQQMLDDTAPPGGRYYDRMHFLDAVSDDFVDALLAGVERVPTSQSHVMIGWLGDEIGRVPAGETAFGHRDARALCWMIGASGEAELGPAREWVRETWEATVPFATGGVYVNALDDGRPVRDAYDDDIYDRLLAVKRRYDPDGAFAGNGIGA